MPKRNSTEEVSTEEFNHCCFQKRGVLAYSKEESL